MRNKLQRLQPVVHSIILRSAKGDIDFKKFKPEDASDFEIILELFIGVEERKGSERFDLTICTPQHILNYINTDGYMIGHGFLIVHHYSYEQIVDYIKSYVKLCTGNTIDDVMRRIGLLGEWESEWEIK